MTGEEKTEGAGLVVIRLTRVGKKKQAHYRIVVADSRRAVKGKFISILGWYNPHTKELQVKEDELKSWLDKGAQPSNTLAKLLKKKGIKLPKWVVITEKKKAKKEKKEAGEKPAPPQKKEEGDVKKEEEKPAEDADKKEEVKEEPEEEKKEEKKEPASDDSAKDSGDEKKKEKPAEDKKAEAPSKQGDGVPTDNVGKDKK